MRLKKFEILGILFTIIAGTLLHFIYAWSHYSSIIALFSPVNESTWEHLKMIFYPYLIYSILEFFVFNKIIKNIITAKFLGVICGLVLIPILFYSCTLVLGKSSLILDICIFCISVIISYIVSYFIMAKSYLNFNIFSLVLFVTLILIFFCFTFYPPKCFIFLDPITCTYGTNTKSP